MHGGGGGCGSRQRQVADGADVVFTDTRVQFMLTPASIEQKFNTTATVAGYLLLSGTQLNKQQLTTVKDHCNKLLIQVIQLSPRYQ